MTPQNARPLHRDSSQYTLPKTAQSATLSIVAPAPPYVKALPYELQSITLIRGIRAHCNESNHARDFYTREDKRVRAFNPQNTEIICPPVDKVLEWATTRTTTESSWLTVRRSTCVPYTFPREKPQCFKDAYLGERSGHHILPVEDVLDHHVDLQRDENDRTQLSSTSL